MNKVTLRPVAITDLNVRIARDMGDNNIRHYRISMPYLTILPEKKPLEMVKEYIVQEEGPTEFFWEEPATQTGIETKDVSEFVLGGHPEIRSALLKRKSSSLLLQYNEMVSIRHRLLNPLKNFVNFFIGKINNAYFWYKFRQVNNYESTFTATRVEDGEDDVILGDFGSRQEADQAIQDDITFYGGRVFVRERVDYKITITSATLDRFAYLDIIQNPLIKPLDTPPAWVRKVSPCTFLTVGFEEDDLGLAVNALLDDLSILSYNDLIIGHLVMPSTMELADTVGSGKKSYVLMCFLHLDQGKLAKVLGDKPSSSDTSIQGLKRLGIKYESGEGNVNWLDGKTPDKKYKISEVLLTPGQKEAYDAYLQSYLDSTDIVNEIASGMAEAIKYVESTTKNNT